MSDSQVPPRARSQDAPSPSRRSLSSTLIPATGAVLIGIGAGAIVLRTFPGVATGFTTPTAIIAVLIWPILAVLALSAASGRHPGSRARVILVVLGHLMIAAASATLAMAIAAPWPSLIPPSQTVRGPHHQGN